MQGNAGYKPAPGYENKLHFIGPVKRPVWIGRKNDVPKLFTHEFNVAYQYWRIWNLGAGLPDPGHWTEQDNRLMKILLLFEEHYRAHFSPERSQQAQLNAILGSRSKPSGHRSR